MNDEDSKIFPQRLMEILNDEGNQEAICWLPDGLAFCVRDKDLFVESVMPRYFSRKAKYSSFTRKLNRWDFKRVSHGPNGGGVGTYYHEFFLRDKPQLTAQMFCKNARTMLAMSSASSAPRNQEPAEPKPLEKPQKKTLSPPEVPPPPVPANSPLVASSLLLQQQQASSFDTLRTNTLLTPLLQQQLLAMLNNEKRGLSGGKTLAAPTALNGARLIGGVTGLQMLERQLQLLQQQEQALHLVERAAAMSIESQRGQAQRLLRMRQMTQLMGTMQQQQQQQQQNNGAAAPAPARRGGPSNNRASAA